MGSFTLRTIRLIAYLALTFALMPLQALALGLPGKLRLKIPLIYHRLCCWIMGLRLELCGRPIEGGPTLFVVNHTSYLDISILAALIPGSFIAKEEVGTWPLFGWLAKLQRTVFIERSRHTTSTQKNDIAARLRGGEQLILFPEGTSNDGNRTLPFKSALFAVAEQNFANKTLLIQPVSIAYTKLDGIPMGRNLRPFFAWYGEMNLAIHLWRMLGLGRVTVAIIFHHPVTLANFRTRKALANYCHRQVSAGVAQAIAGRLGPSIEILDFLNPLEPAIQSNGLRISREPEIVHP